MRKFSNIISLAACFVLLWGCDEYDDGELRQNIDAIEQELTETEKRVERLNEEMNSLSALINSSFISYLKQDDEGNYVISYRDHGGETKTVTLATQDDVVTARSSVPANSPTGNSTGVRPLTTARPISGCSTRRAR